MPSARAHERAPARPLGRVALIAAAWLVAASLGAGTVAAGSPLPAPSHAAPLTGTRTPATLKPVSVTFYGRGYGHGLGLSQYGARGRALAGQLAPEILAHYYEHTTLATQSTATPIRVLVVEGYTPTAAQPARIIGRGGTWTVDGVAGTWPADASADYVRVTSPSIGWRLRIASSGGKLLKLATVGASVRIRPAATLTRLQVLFQPSTYDRYRGTIRLLGSAGGRVTAIDETNVEAYLRGVVPAEMPASWPVEALRAQAIAARSYATAHLHPTTGTWDIYGDSRSQVYRGVLGEQAASTAAVVATAGQVLRSGTKAINALFHSSDGGATEDNENVYVSPTGEHSSTPLAVPARIDGPGTRRDRLRRRRAARDLGDGDVHLRPALGGARGRPADGRRRPGHDRSLGPRRVRPADQRDPHRLQRHEEGVRATCSATVFNTYTPAADPYMWSTLFDIAPIP